MTGISPHVPDTARGQSPTLEKVDDAWRLRPGTGGIRYRECHGSTWWTERWENLAVTGLNQHDPPRVSRGPSGKSSAGWCQHSYGHKFVFLLLYSDPAPRLWSGKVEEEGPGLWNPDGL